MDKIIGLINWFNGRKTYLIAFCDAVYAISGAITGHISWNEAYVHLMSSGALASLRHAIEKK